MLRPVVLGTELPYGPGGSRACDVWETLQASAAGDVGTLRGLLEIDPDLARSEYWYTRPIDLAVRGGHVDAVRLLLAAGGDASRVEIGDDPVTVARDRGHESVALLLEDDRARRGRIPPPAAESGYAAADFEPIDLALWDGPFWGVRGDVAAARGLIERGAAREDLTIASALGDLERVRSLLDEDPARIRAARPCGKRPLSAAVELGHAAIARLLLERGADPTWPEGATAPRGAALHAAARAGDLDLVELLLAHGADPNAGIDSSGSATYAAKTPEVRSLLMAHGGTLDAFDLVFLGEDEEVLRRVAADPAWASTGCGGVLAAACTLGKRDLLVRALAAGARVPPVLTECRSYLLCDPGMLRILLASGMDPDLPNWLHATPLHDLCGRDGRGRPRPNHVESAAILQRPAAAASRGERGDPPRRGRVARREGRGVPLDAARLGGALRSPGDGRSAPRPRRAGRAAGRRAVGDAARVGHAARARGDRRTAAHGRCGGVTAGSTP